MAWQRYCFLGSVLAAVVLCVCALACTCLGKQLVCRMNTNGTVETTSTGSINFGIQKWDYYRKKYDSRFSSRVFSFIFQLITLALILGGMLFGDRNAKIICLGIALLFDVLAFILEAWAAATFADANKFLFIVSKETITADANAMIKSVNGLGKFQDLLNSLVDQASTNSVAISTASTVCFVGEWVASTILILLAMLLMLVSVCTIPPKDRDPEEIESDAIPPAVITPQSGPMPIMMYQSPPLT